MLIGGISSPARPMLRKKGTVARTRAARLTATVRPQRCRARGTASVVMEHFRSPLGRRLGRNPQPGHVAEETEPCLAGCASALRRWRYRPAGSDHGAHLRRAEPRRFPPGARITRTDPGPPSGDTAPQSRGPWSLARQHHHNKRAGPNEHPNCCGCSRPWVLPGLRLTLALRSDLSRPEREAEGCGAGRASIKTGLVCQAADNPQPVPGFDRP